MTQKDTNSNTVKSLVKALNILTLFNPAKNEWHVSEMAQELGYHKSSVQRLVTTLEAEGFLERTTFAKSNYRLGPRILMLGHVASQTLDLRAVARPSLERLAEQTRETSHLCVVDQSQCYYLDKIDSVHAVRISTYVGQRLPLHCSAVGKALLSGMSEEEVDLVIRDCGLPRFTENTITSRDKLLQELARVRTDGLAVDNEEHSIGLRCLAAPVRDNLGRVVAAISFSGPIQRLRPQMLKRYGRSVKEAAIEVSRKLGHVPGSSD